MAMTTIKGAAASDGVAIGIFLTRDDVPPETERHPGKPSEEAALFESSVRQSIEALYALMDRVSREGRRILFYQTNLLSEPGLMAEVKSVIEAGDPAHVAWLAVIDSRIAEEHRPNRVDGMRDVRKRVLSQILGLDTTDVLTGASGLILASNSLTTSEFLGLDFNCVAGIAIVQGSSRSHIAILAQAHGLPMLVGCEAALPDLRTGSMAIIDTKGGRLLHDPDDETLSDFRRLRDKLSKQHTLAMSKAHMPALTRTDEHVRVHATVDDLSVLRTGEIGMYDGIGLTRTEFLFEGENLPDEEQQFQAYSSIIRWAGGRPVVIRTLDAGGDKPIPGVTFDNETNPFLGIRGYRLSRLRKPIFMQQLRALARAARLGPLKVMAPMITVPAEMSEFRLLFAEAVEELQRENIPCAMPALGLMIEVPAAALGIGRFEADFYSIGSNDLVQYVTACARDNALLMQIARPDDPAVLHLIGLVAAEANFLKKEVSVCGEMAAMPSMIPLLLRAGIRSLSVPPGQTPAVKEAIRKWGAPEE